MQCIPQSCPVRRVHRRLQVAGADQPQRERAGLRSQQSEQSQAQTWSSEPAGVNQCVGGEPANHAIRG